MTTPADSPASESDWRSRLTGLRIVWIGIAGAVVLAAIVWNSVAARQQVRIPLAGELSQRPEHEIVAAIKAQGIKHVTIDGGCLVVATADEARCRQILQESAASQGTWADEWQRANDQLNPFSSAGERSAAREIARARRISQMLSEMPGVQHADIVWDEQVGRGFRQESTVRATVYIRPKSDGQLTPQMVASIREAVAGSKANLAVDDVIVMDLSTGMTHRPGDAVANTLVVTAELPQAVAVVPEVAPEEATPLTEATPMQSEVDVQPERPLPSHSALAENSLATDIEALSQPIWLVPPAMEESHSATESTTIAVLDSVAVVAVDLSEIPVEPVGVARLDAEATTTSDVAPAVQQPPQPRRNRDVRTDYLAAQVRNFLGIKSESDIQFLIWVGIGVVVLIAALRGMLRRPQVDQLPDLNLSLHSQQSRPNGDIDHSTSGSRHAAAEGDSVVPHHAMAAPVIPSQDALDSDIMSTGEAANGLEGFDHLAWFEAETIQKLYRCLPDEPWALALSGASTQIQEHVLKCLPRSSAMLLQRRMDSLPAIRLRDVEDAQRRLAEWIRKLDETADVR